MLLPMLFRYALTSTRNREEAMDIVCNVRLIALATLERFDPATGGAGLAKWLMSIVRLKTLELVREKARFSFETEGPDGAIENLERIIDRVPANHEIEVELRHRLISRMRRADLLPRERRYIELFVAGRTRQEVAEEAGVSYTWTCEVLCAAFLKIRMMKDEPSEDFEILFAQLSKVAVYRKPSAVWDRNAGEKHDRARSRRQAS